MKSDGEKESEGASGRERERDRKTREGYRRKNERKGWERRREGITCLLADARGTTVIGTTWRHAKTQKEITWEERGGVEKGSALKTRYR